MLPMLIPYFWPTFHTCVLQFSLPYPQLLPYMFIQLLAVNTAWTLCNILLTLAQTSSLNPRLICQIVYSLSPCRCLKHVFRLTWLKPNVWSSLAPNTKPTASWVIPILDFQILNLAVILIFLFLSSNPSFKMGDWLYLQNIHSVLP